jgi:hypothetical protein
VSRPTVAGEKAHEDTKRRLVDLILHKINYQPFSCYSKAVMSYLGKAETSHVMLADL